MSRIDEIKVRRDEAARVTQEQGWLHANGPSWTDIDYLLSCIDGRGVENLPQRLRARANEIRKSGNDAGSQKDQNFIDGGISALEVLADDIEDGTFVATTPTADGELCAECGHGRDTWNPVTALCEFDPAPEDESSDFCGCKCVFPAPPEAESSDEGFPWGTRVTIEGKDYWLNKCQPCRSTGQPTYHVIEGEPQPSLSELMDGCDEEQIVPTPVPAEAAALDGFHCEQCERDFNDKPHATDDGYWLCDPCWRGLNAEHGICECRCHGYHEVRSFSCEHCKPSTATTSTAVESSSR
jgi:hypothetical protein